MQDKADPSETPAADGPRPDVAASGQKAEPASPDPAAQGPAAQGPDAQGSAGQGSVSGATGSVGPGSGDTDDTSPATRKDPQPEIGGRDGPEPTRYGDWEVNGICTDF